MPRILRARLAERYPSLWDYPTMDSLPAPEWVSVCHFDENECSLEHLQDTLDEVHWSRLEPYLEPIDWKLVTAMGDRSMRNVEGLTHFFWCPDGGSVYAVQLADEE